MNRKRAKRNRKRRRIFSLAVLIAVAAAIVVPYFMEPGIPVFMYHCVADEPRYGDENLYVRPAQLEEEFEFLVNNGYTTLFADEYEEAYSAHKPVILTFDDGYEDNYLELFPLLKKYNLKATIFVAAAYVGSKDYLKDYQIKEMVKSGLVSIQSHTQNHVELSDSSVDEIENEFRASCAELAKITGKNITALSYPGGYFDDEVIRIAKKYFTYCYAIDTNDYSKNNHYEISRGGVFRNTTLKGFEMAIETYSQRRFYRGYLKFKHKYFDS